MTYHDSHQRMRPVLEAARKFDIATNPAPEAIFEVGSAGFQVWCTPADHPGGWDGVPMDAGAFAQPCEFVGVVSWEWCGENIIGLRVETTAYALAEHKRGQYAEFRPQPGDTRRSITNRPEDVAWVQAKTRWLFEEAGVPLPGDFFVAGPTTGQAEFSADNHLEAAYEERTDLGE